MVDLKKIFLGKWMVDIVILLYFFAIIECKLNTSKCWCYTVRGQQQGVPWTFGELPASLVHCLPSSASPALVLLVSPSCSCSLSVPLLSGPQLPFYKM